MSAIRLAAISCSLAIVALGALCACTDSRAKTTSKGAVSTTPLEGPRYLGPVMRTIVVDDGSLTLTPPGATKLRLTWQDAYAQCGMKTGPACDGESYPTISLAQASRPDSPPPILAYVMTWTDGKCAAHGGPGTPVSEPSPCTTVAVVDAETGADQPTLTFGTP